MDQELLIQLLISLVGVLVGAALAFAFNRKLKQMDVIEERKASCRLSAYILYRQYETVLHCFEDHFLPYRNHPHKEEVIPPVRFSNDIANVNVNDLAFLLSTDDPHTLHGIACLQDRYKTIGEILNDRHDFHMRIQAEKGKSWVPGTLGEYDSAHLKLMTDAIFEHVPEFIEAYLISKNRFEVQYESLFKEKGPLNYGDKPNKSSQKDAEKAGASA